VHFLVLHCLNFFVLFETPIILNFQPVLLGALSVRLVRLWVNPALISRLVWQIRRRCLGLLGGFPGWPIQWNHTKCCGPTLVAMATKFGLKSTITRLLWHIDRRCLHLPGGFRGWPIQRNRAKCSGADHCCHGNDICARRGV